MNIRLATPDDAPAIARVHIISWRAAYQDIMPEEKLYGLDYVRITESFRKSISFGAEEIYLAEKNCDVLGFLAFNGAFDLDICRGTITGICAIYLTPENWRKGIGRMLYQACEKTLKSRSCATVTLWVFADNVRARRFYEAMGFTTDGEATVLNMGASVKAVHYRKHIGHAYEPTEQRCEIRLH